MIYHHDPFPVADEYFRQHSALQADLSAANDTDAKRARDWASIIKKLALCLESDADVSHIQGSDLLNADIDSL